MATEIGRVQLSLTGDSRLLAGIAGAVNHVAEAAGIEEKPRADLIAAVEDICEEAVAAAPGRRAHISLTLDALPGKIQIALEFARNAGAKSALGTPLEQAARLHLDSLSRENSGSDTRVTLTKNISS